jgi:hypothetical protein
MADRHGLQRVNTGGPETNGEATQRMLRRRSKHRAIWLWTGRAVDALFLTHHEA